MTMECPPVPALWHWSSWQPPEICQPGPTPPGATLGIPGEPQEQPGPPLTTVPVACRCGTLGDTCPGVGTGHGSPPPHPDPLLCLPLPGSRPPRFDPTAFVRARQRRQKEAELRK